MSNETQLEELIERWEDLFRQGQDIPAEELCRDCPELVETLRRRITGLKSMNWLLESDLAVDESKADPAAWNDLPKAMGRYRLDELVGTGGFGQVWKGFDPELQRVVAIKIPRPDRISPLQTERFVEEARKVAQLKHPGIVPVHDVGREKNFCFIVSDFIEGGSLADRLAKDRLGLDKAARLVTEVADILHYAHQQGFIHRDIKPANLLLGSDDNAFVTDFGIAVSAGQRSSIATAGTLAYSAPGQLGEPAEIDTRTDVYGLGVVFYELLTGRLPFMADDSIELREAILARNLRPPRTFDDKIPLALERVCLKALARNPADRFDSAKNFADELRRAMLPKKRRLWPLGLLVMFLASLGVWNWISSQSQQAEEAGLETTRSGQAAAKKVLETVKSELEFTVPANENGDSSKSKRRKTFSLTTPTVDLTGFELSQADFRQLARHVLLKRLVLADTNTTNDDLSYLRSNSLLETLDLTGTHVSDKGLKPLASLPSLKEIVLAKTKVSDDGLKHLAPMRLRRLDLSNTNVTDVGLAYLIDPYGVARYLTRLNLSGTSVSDASVVHIQAMKQLKELHITETQISDEGIRRIQSALTKCHVQR
jgi:serine/threonine protein kinase